MAGKQSRKSTSSKAPKTNTKKKQVAGQTKAGLVFAPARCLRILRSGRYCDRIGLGAGVFMAGALEYLVREILEIAGDQAEQAKKQVIKPKHIALAVRNDEELTKLMATIQISEGGFKSGIHEFLLPKKSGKKAANVVATQEV